MEEQKPLHKQMDAKELSRKRMGFKDILVKHDIYLFRTYLETDAVDMIEDSLRTQYLNMSDAQLSELMHGIKSHQPYLGEVYQESRNFFRLSQLMESESKFTPHLKQEMLDHPDTFPLCMRCRFFRESPGGDEKSCMQLGNSLPGDIACFGWTPLKKQ